MSWRGGFRIRPWDGGGRDGGSARPAGGLGAAGWWPWGHRSGRRSDRGRGRRRRERKTRGGKETRVSASAAVVSGLNWTPLRRIRGALGTSGRNNDPLICGRRARAAGGEGCLLPLPFFVGTVPRRNQTLVRAPAPALTRAARGITARRRPGREHSLKFETQMENCYLKPPRRRAGRLIRDLINVSNV